MLIMFYSNFIASNRTKTKLTLKFFLVYNVLLGIDIWSHVRNVLRLPLTTTSNQKTQTKVNNIILSIAIK